MTQNEKTQKIAEVVKAKVEKSGMTQKQISKRMDINQADVSLLINGKKPMSEYYLNKFVDALSFSEKELNSLYELWLLTVESEVEFKDQPVDEPKDDEVVLHQEEDDLLQQIEYHEAQIKELYSKLGKIYADKLMNR